MGRVINDDNAVWFYNEDESIVYEREIDVIAKKLDKKIENDKIALDNLNKELAFLQSRINEISDRLEYVIWYNFKISWWKKLLYLCNKKKCAKDYEKFRYSK